MGDVVEPLGVQFRNPLPLLLYHNAQKPVGWVKFSKPTAKGIDFEAKLPVIEELGTVRDRIEEAWISIKSGLIAGVSIGFRAIEEAFNKETMGFHFLQTEVLELSLVAIPAQPDARIDTIKSLDVGLAATGVQADLDRRSSADVPAVTPQQRRSVSMTTISERLTARKTERKDIADKMTALMKPVVEQTGDLTEAQQKEYDDLADSLATVDKEIQRFEALERASVMPTVKHVTGTSFDEGSRSRGSQHIEVKEPQLPPGIGYTRAVICKVASRLFGESPIEIAKARYPSHPSIQAFLKTAVAGGTTTGSGGSPDSGWGSALTATPTTLAAEFLEFLRPMTIVGKFGTGGIPSLTRVPFNIRVQSQTSGGSAAWVGQAKLKPVTKFDYDAVNLYWAKLAAIAVLADELIRFSSPSAEARVRDALTKTIVERMDIDFINPAKSVDANVSPASITNNITALTSTGTDADAVRADVAQALGTFIAANINPTSLVWIMPNTVALTLMLMRNALGQREFPDITMTGGTFEGFPVIASQYANLGGSPVNNIVVLAAASDIFLADDGGVSVDASNQASIEMSDDPEGETGTVVSMFQSNQVALRAERYINWARGRDEAVTYLDGVAWSATT
jgi:HK97 family phage major capsid protein